MIIRIIMALVLSCVAAASWAQTAPAPDAGATPPTKAAVKPADKKPVAKAKTSSKTSSKTGPKTSARPAAAAESGPCQIGVIPAVDHFSVQHVGLTVFGNELAEVPVDSWGIADLVVARIRAAAGASTSVRRIAYATDAFEPYDHPPRQSFGVARTDLATIVRQVAANTRCERYLVVTKSSGQYAGTNQHMDGIGLVTNYGSGLSKSGSIFVYIQITVFDGQSFAKLDDPLDTFGARLAAGFTADESLQGLTDFEPPASPEDVINNARLRDGARALLAARLDKMLPAYLNDAGKSQ